MKAYNAPDARDSGGARHGDRARARSRTPRGMHAPKFEIERVIAGSPDIITGAPFDGGKDSPLWADAKAKVAKLQSSGKISAKAECGFAARRRPRSALLAIKPGL